MDFESKWELSDYNVDWEFENEMQETAIGVADSMETEIDFFGTAA